MSQSLLYYPFIQVPNNNWLKTSLLYYDEVGSIIPGRFGNIPGEFKQHMLELLNEGLIKRHSPSNVLSCSDRETEPAAQEFVRVVDAILDPDNVLQEQGYASTIRPYSGDTPDMNWLTTAIPIYYEKMDVVCS